MESLNSSRYRRGPWYEFFGLTELVFVGATSNKIVLASVVRRYGTKDDALLSRRQVHEVKLTVNPVRPSERRGPMITLQHSQALCSIGGG